MTSTVADLEDNKYFQIPRDGVASQPAAWVRWFKVRAALLSGAACLLYFLSLSRLATPVSTSASQGSSAGETVNLFGSTISKSALATPRSVPRNAAVRPLMSTHFGRLISQPARMSFPGSVPDFHGFVAPRSLSISHAHGEADGSGSQLEDTTLGKGVESIGRRAVLATGAAAAAAAASARSAAAESAETVGERATALKANVGPWEYVILGAGNAGGYAARELVKQLGPDVKGKVLIIGSEPVVPYERPALTKAYLHPPGAKVRARLPGFHTSVGGGGDRQAPEWYEERGIGVLTSTKVSKVDAKAKTLTLEGTGETLKYGTLFYCTGASALKAADVGIENAPSSGVYYVREEADASRLVSAFEDLQKKKEKGKVVLVGGGYVGLEVAAAAAGWGFEPTVVLGDQRVLPKVFPEKYSESFRKRYEDAGVKFMFGSRAASFSQDSSGGLAGVVLKDGTTVPADMAVLGIGSKPNLELLSGQVKEKDGGVLVDDQMRTSDKNIYAFGDVATFPLDKELRRLEHVAHARASAAHAVQAATGAKPGAYKTVPYFYSRVFEYTDKPLVWNLYGDQKGEHTEFQTPSGALGEVWVDKGKISGALVFGYPPSKEDGDLAKGAVAERKAAKTAADAALLLGPKKEA